MTIKRKLLGLTITGLAFVLAISATGYWGISTVQETTSEVAATGSAIRNHVAAGVYNDMTRTDIAAVFTTKGDGRQNKLEDLAQHSRLLRDRIAKTQERLVDTALRARLADESRMVDRYGGPENHWPTQLLNAPLKRSPNSVPICRLISSFSKT
jgi:hypothetical protein